MEKRIITISREFGSGGRTIGKRSCRTTVSCVLICTRSFFRRVRERWFAR